MIAQKAKKSKHFQYDTRLLLEHYLLGKGHFPKITDTKELAEIFRKSVRTIEREIRRGLVCHLKSDLTEVWEYNADFAQRAADYEKSAKGAPIKLSNNKQLLGQIAFLINEQNFSPYAVIEHLKREDFYGCTHFCEKSLYNYISKGLIDCVTVKNLPNKGVKFKEKETKPKFSRAECALRSIDNRPAEINDRSEVGHWEIDTVKSAKDTGNACLLTLTERKTRAEIAVKMNDGTAASVVSELDKIEDKIGREEGKYFLMGETEITQKQYQEIIEWAQGNEAVKLKYPNIGDANAKPSYFKDNPADYEKQENRPVERVTWYGAVMYCNLLTMREIGESECAYKITNPIFLESGDIKGYLGEAEVEMVDGWENKKG